MVLTDQILGPQQPALFAGPDPDPDRFRIDGTVGSGGEGVVFRAREQVNPTLLLDKALKMLRLPSDARGAETMHRWREQAALLSHIKHAGIVTAQSPFEGGPPHRPGEGQQEPRCLYLPMGWVEGLNLKVWAQANQHRIGQLSTLDLLQPAAEALDLIHGGSQTGGIPVVHGDFKPSNLVVSGTRTVLVDFGLVRSNWSEPTVIAPGFSRGYVAPEVLSRGEVSAAADRYSFAAVAFYLLTGHDPPHPHDPRLIGEALDRVASLTSDDRWALVQALSARPGDRPDLLVPWLALFEPLTTDNSGPPPMSTAEILREPVAVVSSPDNRSVRYHRASGDRLSRSSGRALVGLTTAVLVAVSGIATVRVFDLGKDQATTTASSPTTQPEGAASSPDLVTSSTGTPPPAGPGSDGSAAGSGRTDTGSTTSTAGSTTSTAGSTTSTAGSTTSTAGSTTSTGSTALPTTIDPLGTVGGFNRRVSVAVAACEHAQARGVHGLLLSIEGVDYIVVKMGELDGSFTKLNQPNIIVGTDGPDNIQGFDGNDIACGFGGNDALAGNNGDDVLVGGSGIDVFTGNAGRDLISGDNEDYASTGLPFRGDGSDGKEDGFPDFCSPWSDGEIENCDPPQ